MPDMIFKLGIRAEKKAERIQVSWESDNRSEIQKRNRGNN